MGKNQPPGFNNPPPGVRKKRAVLNVAGQTYSPIGVVAGKQPWYKYQGIGRVTAIVPDPPVWGFVLSVGRDGTTGYGYDDGEYGEIQPRAIDGDVINRLLVEELNNVVLSVEGGEQIGGLNAVTIECEGLEGVYILPWIVAAYVSTNQDLMDFIVSNYGNDININIITI